MNKHRNVFIVVALVVLAAVLSYSVYRQVQRKSATLSERAPTKLDAESSALNSANARTLRVKIYLYNLGQVSPGADFLVAEDRTIFETGEVVLNARQIVGEVLKTRAADVPHVFPPEARLRQIHVLTEGTAVVDLSGQTAEQLVGGVNTELAAIYSITRSLMANIPAIKRVKFLVEGEERPTLAGHVSIRHPFM